MRYSMISIPNDLLDAYAEELAIAECNFEMMGELLDVDYLKNRLDYLSANELYVYGGGYLGIQFYRACNKLIKILSIVDKQGCLRFNIPDIPVTNLDGLKKAYRGEKIIITSARYYQEIQKDLLPFVPKSQILFLGEFLGGIL